MAYVVQVEGKDGGIVLPLLAGEDVGAVQEGLVVVLHHLLGCGVRPEVVLIHIRDAGPCEVLPGTPPPNALVTISQQ